MMDEDKKELPSNAQKNPIESLSKEEIINKYKGLLGIAKKAKQAKDELLEENRQLKETLSRSESQKQADKQALLTMKEMVEQFTENKLQLTSQLAELQRKSKADEETLSQLSIENESLKRQLSRLTDENESLLSDIDGMENNLKQVNLIGMEQKTHLELLEQEILKLKESQYLSETLGEQLNEHKQKINDAEKGFAELKEKYDFIKSINSEQRKKFNSLKDRFLEVHRKLMKLKECKRILLETQREYADSVTRWQNEIINASQQLCADMNALRQQNEKLQLQLEQAQQQNSGTNSVTMPDNQSLVDAKKVQELCSKLLHMQQLGAKALQEQSELKLQLSSLEAENGSLKSQVAKNDMHHLELATQHSFNNSLSKRLQQEFSQLQRLGEQSLQEQSQLKNELIELQQENKRLKSDSALNENINTQVLCGQIEDLKLQLATKEQHNKELMQAQEKLEASSKVALQELHKTQQTSLNTIEELSQQRNSSLKELQQLQQQHNQIREQLQQSNEQLKALESEKLQLLQQRQAVEKSEANAKHDMLKDLQQELEDCRHAYEELLNRYEVKEREHTDLLGEMRELNEALKARGDVISRQQEKQQELTSELKNTTQRLQQLELQLTEKDEQARDINCHIEVAKQQVQQLETVCSQREQELKSLNSELQQLRSAGEKDAGKEDMSDVLSTSTISRAEEINRLRELDDSFEEKYNRLKGLAMKLKKKLQEQTLQMQQLEKQNQSNTQTSSGLQDISQQLEEFKKRTSDLEHQHEQSKKLIESLKQENQKLKTSRKQSNMLNLEIEAAEKSLAEVSSKLSAKTAEMDNLNQALESKETSIVLLRKEISILESAKTAEATHAQELKTHIDHLQSELKDSLHAKQQAQLQCKQLQQDLESLKRELEALKLQLAHSGSKHENSLQKVVAEKEQTQQKLLESQNKFEQCQQALKLAERSLEDLQLEYTDYKLKAQAVLRKNQSKDSSKERELEEEVLSLKTNEKQLQAEMQLLEQRWQEQQKQYEMLSYDNESLRKRNSEVLNLVEQLKEQNEQLAQENRNMLHNQQESLKSHRQQIESLDVCHKQQLAELQSSHQQLVQQLQAEIRQPTSIGAASNNSVNSNNNNANRRAPLSREQSKIEFLLMEREDAEGSEAAESLATLAAKRKISNVSLRQRPAHHDFMPLDELLNTPMTAISDAVVTTITSDGLHGNKSFEDADNEEDTTLMMMSSHVELQNTKELLQKAESKVRHLTSLLGENEQDLARLTQMNNMLKEELRRQERGVEREKHMHNSEYLKNVFLKFLTLNNGDERTRLVPVLNTILKLSKAEMDVLNCVAKGQKVPNDGGKSSWGSFLWGNNNT